MTFIRFWMGATIFGLASAVLVLHWALKARQFKESDRAAHLPLGGITAEPPEARGSRDAAVLATVLGLGIAVLAASVALSVAWVE